MITVHGRVRATVRLRQNEVDAPCVVATSWASDRAFPRTVGVGVAFEIETAGGEVFRVDPFQATVALPVRRREREGGVSREYAWLSPADEITVDGDVDAEAAPSASRALHATRIALPAPGAASVHRLPPRTLRSGEADVARVEREPEPPVEAEPPVPAEPEATTAPEPEPEPQVDAEAGAATPEPPPASSNGSTAPAQKRRKQKKLPQDPDPTSGTPTPTQ